jgi:hypothetical protein
MYVKYLQVFSLIGICICSCNKQCSSCQSPSIKISQIGNTEVKRSTFKPNSDLLVQTVGRTVLSMGSFQTDFFRVGWALKYDSKHLCGFA